MWRREVWASLMKMYLDVWVPIRLGYYYQRSKRFGATYPNERILGVANGGQGAQVEDDCELGLLQG